jgi:hypothetical protein
VPSSDGGGKLDAAQAVALLGAAALRVFNGAELAAVIEYVARTHPRPVDAADGRPPRSLSPTPPDASSAAPARLAGPRPHRPFECPGGPNANGCTPCHAWVAAVMAAPAPELPPIRPPAERAQRSPYAVGPRPAAAAPLELAKPTELSDTIARVTSRELATPEEQLAAAQRRSVRWERTQCYAKHGDRCGPSAMSPCRWCIDQDFPFRALVDGTGWKLRYNGPRRPSTLVIDGRDIGDVGQRDWPGAWRTFGAPTGANLDQREEEDEDSDG